MGLVEWVCRGPFAYQLFKGGLLIVGFFGAQLIIGSVIGRFIAGPRMPGRDGRKMKELHGPDNTEYWRRRHIEDLKRIFEQR